MSTDETGLLVKLEANVSKWEKDFNRAIAKQDRSAKRMEQIAQRNAKKIEDSYSKMATNVGRRFNGLGNLMGPLAGGLSNAVIMRQVRNYTRLADAATQMQNSLKVAGLEGANLADVYNKLFRSAQKNSAPINSLVDLYSKLALTQKELGVSNEELIRFTDGVAVALKVAGTDATTASGSLLQLSQALGGGIVRAEEFNSILEGTPTIAQAVARGLKEANGSVAELRKLVVDGRVSSTAFFRAFEAGSDVLRDQAESSQSTVAQAFTRIGNSLVTVVGEFDRASGASKGFADMISEIGEGIDNLDVEGFIADVRRITDALRDAEEAGTTWLNNLGNAQVFKDLNEFLSYSENGNALTIETIESERKIAALEKEVDALQSQIENNTELGFDNTEAIARLREVRSELAAVRAEAASMPRYESMMDSGTFITRGDYTAPTPAPVASVVSIEDHPAAGGGSKGGKGGKGASGSKSERLDDFQREVKAIRERTAALQVEAASLALVAASGQDYGDALEFARTRAEMLSAAQMAGRQITPELTAQVDQMAQAYVTAGMEAEAAAEKLDQIKNQSERGKDALESMFGSVIDGSMSAKEAVGQLLAEIAKAQLLKGIMALPGMGSLSGFAGGLLPGFSEGGFTGAGGKYEAAGVVHRGEYVMPKSAVQRIGVGNLEALHKSALRGYSDGGLVGATSKLSQSVAGSDKKSAPMQINITGGAITVNASGGTTEQNHDLARQIARESEKGMRRLIQDEMVKQMRPGGMLR